MPDTLGYLVNGASTERALLQMLAVHFGFDPAAARFACHDDACSYTTIVTLHQGDGSYRTQTISDQLYRASREQVIACLGDPSRWSCPFPYLGTDAATPWAAPFGRALALEGKLR